MENVQDSVFEAIEYAGWLAPLIFIVLHLIRPLIFLPVVLVCMAGGYFFGFVAGSIYSLIGLSLMCALFYGIVNYFPKFRDRVARLKKKVFNDRDMTPGQIIILRMMPFIHFHLLSLYIMEMTPNFQRYMYFSIIGVIGPAVVFTGFGHMLVELPWGYALLLIGMMGVVFVILGRKEDQVNTFGKKA
jgi:uncharacterized membrane protein YdjX (TVP38/TMEM64 family)